jgi:hypothetical protein
MQPQGLVRGQMPPEQEPSPEMGMPPARGGNEDMQQADPMARIMLAAGKVIYDKQTSDGVVQMLQSGQPVVALAQAALMVMKTLFDASQQSLPKEMIAPAAVAVVDELAELADAAGVDASDQDIEQAKGIVNQKLTARFGQPAQNEMVEA